MTSYFENPEYIALEIANARMDLIYTITIWLAFIFLFILAGYLMNKCANAYCKSVEKKK